MPYNAFISYSHAADGKLAPAVQSALHSFARPWYRRRAMHVFRDKTSLSATPELWGSIEDALGSSEFFILLASPESASSKWVQKEVRWWLDNQSVNTILICLTGGKLCWEGAAFDPARTTALPPDLLNAFAQEPFYADLSWAHRSEHLSRDEARFKEAITQLAATIHRRPMDEMAGEDVRRHRQTRMLATSAAVAILISLVIAVVQWQTAAHERDTAIGLVAQMSVNNGLDLAAKDDAFGALSWFAQALHRDHDNTERERLHRIRLGLHMRALPTLLHSWQLDQPVTDAEFSPDGRWVVTASGVSYPSQRSESQGAARVWDAASGRPVSPPLRHEGTVYSASFSPDGKQVLSAGGDGGVRIWSAKSGELLLNRIRPGGTVRLARFSPDGSRIATAGGGVARVWDAATGEPLTPPLGIPDRTVWHVEFSPDASKLLATYGNGFSDSDAASARIWDTATGEPVTPVIQRGGKWVYYGAFSADGTRFVLADAGGKAQIYATDSGEAIGEPFEHMDRIAHASFSPDGNRLITAGWDGLLRIRWIERGLKKEGFILTVGGQVRQLSWSPDGQLLVTGSSTGMARVWNIDTGEPVSPELRLSHLPERAGPLYQPGETSPTEFAVNFAPDGRRLVTTGWDGTVRIWDLAGRVIKSMADSEQKSFLTLPPAQSTRVSVERQEDHVLVTESASGREMRLPVIQPQAIGGGLPGEIIKHWFSGDGNWLAVANTSLFSQGWLFVTRMDAFTPRRINLDHPGTLSEVVFGPFGERIFVILKTDSFIKGRTNRNKEQSGRAPEFVRAWELDSGRPATQPMEESDPVRKLQFDPSGERLIGTWGSAARIWDARSGGVLSKPMVHAKPIKAIAFSPDGRLIATSSEDGTARVWDATTGEPQTPPLRHGPEQDDGKTRTVTAVCFDAGSTLLATTDNAGIARVWEIATAQPLSPELTVGFTGTEIRFDRTRRELVIADAIGAETVFDIAPMAGTRQEVAMVAQALSARKFDASEVLTPLSGPRVSELFAKINATPTMSMAPVESQTMFWHKIRVSGLAEYGQQRQSRRFHLDRIIEAGTDEPVWYLKRAAELVEIEQPGQAVADYTKALQLGAEGDQPLASRGVANVMANNLAEAAKDFAAAIERGDKSIMTLLNLYLTQLATEDRTAYRITEVSLLDETRLRGSGTWMHDRIIRALAIRVYMDGECGDTPAFIQAYGGGRTIFGEVDKICSGDLQTARDNLERYLGKHIRNKPVAESFMFCMLLLKTGDPDAARGWFEKAQHWRSELALMEVLKSDSHLNRYIGFQPALRATPLLEVTALERAANKLLGSRSSN